MVEEIKEKERNEEKSLEKMTVKELKAIAMEIPRSVAIHDMKKGELIAFIKEAKGIKEEKHVKAGQKAVVEKLKLTKSQIKEKIKQLKEEKRIAHETNNRKKIDFLRRRICHFKKQTRKLVHA